jgi:hypothetical protein
MAKKWRFTPSEKDKNGKSSLWKKDLPPVKKIKNGVFPQ